ncbi:MAG: hypothetical protein UIC45_03035 [Paludibacteraceae bacterium]|nr:hypothetical protein [Paludibacteraceae bacterium]
MKKILYLISFLFAVALVGCEEKEPPTSAKVRTGQVTNITDEAALIEASVNVDISKYNSVNFGVMYSTYLEDINYRNGNEEFASYMNGKEYEVEIANLSPNTKYYYCAYLVLNGIQREFGQIKEFTTLPANEGSDDEGGSEEDEGGSEGEDEGGSEGEGGTEDEGDGKVNGYSYVDLGLSVKWATMNVGATSPEEYGDYFAWGETEPKEEYSWETYKWCDGDFNNLTKYCSSSEFGIVDNKTKLEPEDDAATVNWGGAWRMPTKAELDELIENCTWSWTTQNGVDGYTVTSNTNGKSIFLPAAGYRNETFSDEVGTFGYYWSSLHDNANFQHISHNIYFEESNVDKDSDSRYYGNSIRPVLP